MKIGWASVDITPERPVVLRGQFHARISNRVNDPLLATALVLSEESAGEHVVMVSCDRVSIPSGILQRVREAVASRAKGLDARRVFLNATHTHTAPEIEEGHYPPQGPEVMTPTEYADLFVDRVAECIARAWENQAPGAVGWGFGQAVVGHNRRASYFGGVSRMYGATNTPEFEQIEGYEDHGVDLLYTWDPEGRLTGMIVNLACPSQVTEGEHYVSADFWHEVRVELARRVGEGLFLLPQCSAAGDQSPHLLLHARAEERMRRLRGVTEREELARRIVDAVTDVLPVAETEKHSDVPLRHAVRTLHLPARAVTRDEYEHAVREYETYERQQVPEGNVAGFSRRFRMLNRYRRVMERYRSQGEQPTFAVETHLVRVGDVGFATNPFELFLDFGERIKARSKAVQTFVVQLAGGGAAYLPTARAVAGQGYGAEPVSNHVGPEGGQVLVEESLAMLNAFWEE
ncbi:MAG TPA: hypothetical protein GX715_18935 [Armatimonadetes bacterium]|jgi:hypothetical protein|nr:hypothetical protein [Armatimonadota bacterium]